MSCSKKQVVQKNKSSCKCAINSGMCQNSNLIHLFSFYSSCLPDDVLCTISNGADDTALKSSFEKTSDSSHWVGTAYEL